MAEGLHNDVLAAHRPVVRAVVAHVLGARPSEPDVEDCTSEAFRRALEGQARLQPGAALRPWLLGIARHVALDARRARQRARMRAAKAGADDEREPLDAVADATPDPLQRAELSQRTERLQQALATLPKEQRRALTLHAEGLGYREIAAELAVPIGTVCTWIARARQTLARVLNDLPSEATP
ncbi:MAG: sigma-70 family RNA polymerase sigma factor [Polyangiales bacterium]